MNFNVKEELQKRFCGDHTPKPPKGKIAPLNTIKVGTMGSVYEPSMLTEKVARGVWKDLGLQNETDVVQQQIIDQIRSMMVKLTKDSNFDEAAANKVPAPITLVATGDVLNRIAETDIFDSSKTYEIHLGEHHD